MGHTSTFLILNNFNQDCCSDVVFLCETMLLASKIEGVKTNVRLNNYFALDKVGRGDGIAALCKDEVKCTIDNYFTHHIDLIVEGDR